MSWRLRLTLPELVGPCGGEVTPHQGGLTPSENMESLISRRTRRPRVFACLQSRKSTGGDSRGCAPGPGGPQASFGDLRRQASSQG